MLRNMIPFDDFVPKSETKLSEAQTQRVHDWYAQVFERRRRRMVYRLARASGLSTIGAIRVAERSQKTGSVWSPTDLFSSLGVPREILLGSAPSGFGDPCR